MQSGKAGLNHYRLDFDALAGSGRWINPLMGWASSADYMQGTSMKFQTEEEAVRFCEKQGQFSPVRSVGPRTSKERELTFSFGSFDGRSGWEYIVQKPNVQPFKPKTYSENYTYVPYVSVLLASLQCRRVSRVRPDPSSLLCSSPTVERFESLGPSRLDFVVDVSDGFIND